MENWLFHTSPETDAICFSALVHSPMCECYGHVCVLNVVQPFQPSQLNQPNQPSRLNEFNKTIVLIFFPHQVTVANKGLLRDSRAWKMVVILAGRRGSSASVVRWGVDGHHIKPQDPPVMSEIIIEMPPDFSHQVPFFVAEILSTSLVCESLLPGQPSVCENNWGDVYKLQITDSANG